MSATGLEVFDKTLQTTHIWLDEIMADHGPDRRVAWHMLGAVLRTLRDWLQIELAANLGAELPLLIRGAYYDRYRPHNLPTNSRSLEEFLQRVAEEMKSTRRESRGCDEICVQSSRSACRPRPVGESARRFAETHPGALARKRRSVVAAKTKVGLPM